MKKKGFTLIELLAVIIILAVIALIATPMILNVVEEAREEARKDSILGYADAVKLSYTESIIKPPIEPLDKLASSKMQGDEVICEFVKYDSKNYGTLLYGCKVENKGNYCYFNGKVFDTNTEECNNVYNMIFSENIPYKTPVISVINKNPENTEYAQSKKIKVEYPSLNLVEEHYYIKSNKIVNINNIKSTCGTDGIPGECTNVSLETIEANTWYEVSGDIEFDINENIEINAIIGNNNEYGVVATYQEEKIDTTSPTTSIKDIVTTTNKVVVYEECEDSESGIIKKEYSMNNGAYQESNIFENLSNNGTYTFKVKCTNGSGMSVEAETEEEISLKELKAPTITQISQKPENSEYATERTIRITYYNENIESPRFYYSLDGNTWTESLSTTEDLTFTDNAYLYAKTVDGSDNETVAATYTVDNIDATEPSVEITVGTIKTDRITVTGSCSDLESGITKYEFSSDNGASWVDKGTTNNHTFTNLDQTKDYTFVLRCTNGSSLNETDNEVGRTSTIINPTISQYSQTPKNSTYATSRVIRITFNGTNVENPTHQYSLDGNNWTTVNTTTQDITFTSNGYLYARTMDAKGNIANASTYTVDNIDTTEPSTNISVGSVKTDRATVTASCSDIESGITKYEFSSNNGNSWVNNGTTNNHTFTNLDQTKDYTFVVRCTNGAGLTETDSEVGKTSTIENPTISQYSQTPANSTYAQSRVIRITFNGTNIESPTYQYSTNGTNWTTVTSTTKDVTFTSNGYLYARTTDPKGNIANASTYTVDNIDTTEPSASISSVSTTAVTATITGSCEDLDSGISKTEYSKDGTTWQTSNVISGLLEGTDYTFRIRCINGSGIEDTASYVSTTKQTYTISYNLNGGTGNIASTTKTQDVSVNITNVVPTRTGYNFMGWGTSATDTTVDYASNVPYTANASIELFAIWRKTVTVTYNGNGSTSGSTASQQCYMYNADANCQIKLNGNGFTKTSYNFQGWGTGTSNVTHNAGTTYNFSSNTTLNAIWESAEWPVVTDTNPGVICGTGTSEAYSSNTVCNINSIEDLVAFSNLVNSGNNFSGKTVNLNVNLDFKNTNSYKNSNTTSFGDINENGIVEGLMTELTTGAGFKPIGSDYYNRFDANFNGDAHKIANLYIYRPKITYVGLFGITHGSIQALTLENTNITGGNNVGGVAGFAGKMNEIVHSGNVTATYSNVGGIAGGTMCTELTNLVSSGTVKSTWHAEGGTNAVGGLLGGQCSTATILGVVESGSVEGNYGIGKASGSDEITYYSRFNVYVSSSVTRKGYLEEWCYYNSDDEGNTCDDYIQAEDGKQFSSSLVGDLATYESFGIDTSINGDNDGSGYYIGYDNNGKLSVLKAQ